MLMFAYTFAGKLWISLGYDENGFERKTVDLFWENVEAAIHEFFDSVTLFFLVSRILDAFWTNLP